MFNIPLPFTDLVLPIRWYAMSYIVGLLLAWQYCMRLAAKPPNLVTPRQIDDFLLWATLGVIVGARLGIVLFYKPSFYLANPLEILKVWKGGMSFHGGLVGVVIAMLVFARRHRIPFLGLTDIVCAAAPIGLFLGRVANFINGELWGRPATVPWAMIFPHAPDNLPRHPSQLYEAALEGVVLFLVLAILVLGPPKALRRPGLTTGVFLAGYALGRGFVETLREPDSHIGLLSFGTTWGQWLTLPMLLGGAYLVWRALRREPVTA
ncbi:MAG: prolipoprotein diacylglyceryl transferase [Rhodospirillales bacterium]|nr:MAG: prolipoprotein diacylglyceryl transferase [Rhodospirillales bacterium]